MCLSKIYICRKYTHARAHTHTAHGQKYIQGHPVAQCATMMIFDDRMTK